MTVLGFGKKEKSLDLLYEYIEYIFVATRNSFISSDTSKSIEYKYQIKAF